MSLRPLLIVLGVLGVAALARAQAPTPVPRDFIYSGAAGEITGPIWATGGGTAVTAYRDGSGVWWQRLALADGGTGWVETSLSSFGEDYSLAFRIQADAFPPYTCSTATTTNCTQDAQCPSSGTCTVVNEQEVLRGYAGSDAQVVVALGSDRRLRVHWRDLVKECTANSAYPYTDCTSVSDCPVASGGNPGESDCSEAIFAKTERLTAGQTYLGTVVVSADTAGARPHDVRVALYFGGSARGSKTRREGVCSGGTLNGKACGASADCPGGGTCGSSNIGSLTAVRVGATSAAKGYTVNLGGYDFLDSDQDPYVRYEKVVPLYPSSSTARVDWNDVNANCTGGVHAGCIDDTDSGAIDDDAGTPGAPTTTLNASTQNDTDIWELDDYTLGTGESVVAAVAYGAMREQADNGNTNKTVAFGLRDNNATSQTDAGHEATASIDLAPDGEAQKTRAGAIAMTNPSGAAWSQTNLNQLRGVIRYTGATGTGNRVRLTNAIADVAVALPTPATPTTMQDLNSDTKVTVCFIGDSILNDPAFYDALNGQLEQPDNILHCALGGRTCGDMLYAFPQILDGEATPDSSDGLVPNYYSCIAERGDTGHKCDYAFLQCGANNVSGELQRASDGFCFQRGCVGGSNAGLACKVAGDCPGGTCTDAQGPQYGVPCAIPSGTKGDNGAAYLTGQVCLNGDNIAKCCAGLACPSPSDCGGGPKKCFGGTNANAQCSVHGDCNSNLCIYLGHEGNNDLTDNVYGPSWCVAGSVLSRECPSGVCVAEMTTAYLESVFGRMVDIAEARTGSSTVQLVLMGNVYPWQQRPKRCVTGASHGATCSVDGDCTAPGECHVPNNYARWSDQQGDFAYLNRYTKALAADRGLPYLDGYAYLRRIVWPQSYDVNVRDGIHLSESGQEHLATCVTALCEEDSSVAECYAGDI